MLKCFFLNVVEIVKEKDMKYINKNFFMIASLALFFSCGTQKKPNAVITVINKLEIPRSFETIEISKTKLNLREGEEFNKLVVRDVKTKEPSICQFVDKDGDGSDDVLLFQPKIAGGSEKSYELVIGDKKEKCESTEFCYSRFVPERTDDYAWENDKVAFRVFGPAAQKIVEDKLPGGTLSSGVDAWLKKVPYPIINNWYKKNDIRPGAYHEMSPEGLDNFHVGVSRGIGGTAVKKESKYFISRNYTKWRTITTGPIRTSFVLDYADWNAEDQLISEKKYISLDYGSNLSRFEIHASGTDVLSVGITLHENDGFITENVKNGWVSYWEPHEASELGTAIIAPKGNMIGSEYYVTTEKDRSNLYAQLKVEENKVIYYAGFAWKESEQYPTKASWEKYLKDFALRINNPLEIVFEQ